MEFKLASLNEFTGLSIPGLDSYDILALNFHAARGLPGTQKSNLDAWLAKRNEWAGRIKFEICRHLYRFDEQANQVPTPYTYGNSLARFFCWYMLQVMQLHCGVTYHPDRKFKPDFCQPRDVFAHGIMDDDGQGGTCASMPVVYVSMGRYIGLPLHLVSTRGHAFVRWDDPKGTTIRWENPNFVLWIPPDRFNIEGSGEGIAFYSDAYYTGWPEQWTEFDILHGRYLRSETAKEAMSQFLMERGECFWDLKNRIEALQSYHYARQLVPDNERYNNLHSLRSRQYQEWESGQREMERIDHEIEQMTRDAENRRLKWQGAAADVVPRDNRWQPPMHGPSCRCFDCNKEMKATLQSTGMPGHPANCQCPGCIQRHRMPPAPGGPAFGTPNRVSHEPVHPTVPGFQQPSRHITGH